MLTQDKLKEVLDYDPDTGIFKWKKYISSNASTGRIAGNQLPVGYISIQVSGTRYYAHRLAFLYMEGYFPENQVDHINKNKCDNSWNNLREVSIQCNARNVGNHKDNTSGVKGVDFIKARNKWRARITNMGNSIHLGLFNSFKDAVIARYKAEQYLNWTGCDTNSPAFNYIMED